MSTTATIKDLRAELDELRTRHSKLPDDDLFVLWFLLAFVTDNEDAAVRSICGRAGDKNNDAIFIDEDSKTVVLVQAKYRHKLGQGSEKRSDVLTFTDLASTLTSGDAVGFKEFVADADPFVTERLKQARKRLLSDGYRLWLYYVTLGRCSPTIKKDAENKLRGLPCRARIDILDDRRLVHLLQDYLDGVAPPIPELSLEMEQGQNVSLTGILQRTDYRNGTESWVFSMRGDRVGELFTETGVRLFARNIRGFLGNTPINAAMVNTLRKEPDKFFYYNNGISIVCDQAEEVRGDGRIRLKVSNPQVINGQQTTRTLAEHQDLAKWASVLVKVIRIPRDADGHRRDFDSLVSSIVAGTNWQNAIKEADLRSNDRRQIEIERAFRKLGYLYLRKRQSKNEARRFTGGRWRAVKKEELAQTIAACDLDPLLPREGKDNLFKAALYEQVFPNSDPNYLLPRYCLNWVVTYRGRGKPQRGYAKWVVLNFLWSQIGQRVKTNKRAQTFRIACENWDRPIVRPLERMAEFAFVEAVRFYRAKRGEGDKAIDVSSFFKKKGLDRQFADFWDHKASGSRRKFAAEMKNFEKGLEGVEY